MKIRNIQLRKELDLDTLKSHIKRFFNFLKNRSKSQYINIQLGFWLAKGNDLKRKDVSINLGTKHIINIESNEEQNWYIDYIINQYNNEPLIRDDSSYIVSNISFDYIDASQDEYDNYIKKILNDCMEKDSKLEISDVKNIKSNKFK